MDLANTPTLFRSASLTPPAAGQCGDVLTISPAHAQDLEFVEAWEQLARSATESNPFFEPWFVLPSLNSFAANARIELFAHFNEGALTGLLPVGRTLDYYGNPVPQAASWLHDNAFCGSPLVARGHERSFWRGLFGHFDRHPRLALFLHLPMLPVEGPLSAALAEVIEEQDRASYIATEASRAYLSSDLGSGEYLSQSMSGKKRKELRRQHKRLEEEGALTFSRSDDMDGIDQWIADFVALEAAGWKGRAGSALGNSLETHEFFATTLKGAAAAGRLERLTMSIDGWPIAMLVNFVTAPGIYSFKTAFDETYARFSPGMLLQLENLALLDRQNIDWADSCAAEGHPMIERLWREKRTLRSYNIAIGGPLRRAVFNRLMAYETRNRSGS